MSASGADKTQATKRALTPEATRALAEAKTRKVANKVSKILENQSDAAEHGGPKGLEPTRYGDWERKGILSDF